MQFLHLTKKTMLSLWSWLHQILHHTIKLSGGLITWLHCDETRRTVHCDAYRRKLCRCVCTARYQNLLQERKCLQETQAQVCTWFRAGLQFALLGVNYVQG